MLTKKENRKTWAGVSPWVLIGAVAVLLPIFTFMTIENINRQKKKSTHLLLEKGAALIRSFEAGTRTGMMGMHRGVFQLQRLLTEMAQQPDVVYLYVTDKNGNILAHNDLELVGTRLDREINPENIARSQSLFWRRVVTADGTNVFEIFRKFTPQRRWRGPMHGSRAMGSGFQAHRDRGETPAWSLNQPLRIIFVGLDMTPIIEAQSADIRHAIVMGIILLMVGFAGITLLFLFSSYRTTRASLSRIKAFSDNVVENMPIGLIALDDRLKIASFNHTAESVLKISQQDVAEKDADKILPGQLRTAIDSPEIEDHVVEGEVE
jgi:two-component system sensor histidine kinase HydH